MSYGQPWRRRTAGPSTGPASTYPTFRTPASICRTTPNVDSGEVTRDISRARGDGGNRCHRLQDHLGHRLRLGDHDHVRAVELGDVRTGPLRHGANHVRA